MNLAAQQDYLTNEIMTATPQRLQLMLIEGALRHGNIARDLWREEKLEDATEALIRAQQIVTELLCGLKPREEDKEVVNKVAAIYLFVFRSMISAQMDKDPQKLDEAISVLEIERETWQQVCKKDGTIVRGDAPSAIPAPGMPAPGMPATGMSAAPESSMTSFEA